MLIRSFNSYAGRSRRVLTSLVFCLVFASAHFVLHDSEEANSDLIAQDECQVCRLNHVPFISTPALALFTPVQVAAYDLHANTYEPRNTLRFPTLGARAPPLS